MFNAFGVSRGRSPKGERNAYHTRPEIRIRGDNHWTRKKPYLVVRGEKHPDAKLKEIQVKEIRLLFEEGSRVRDIAKKFGVSEDIISRITRYKTWKHI